MTPQNPPAPDEDEPACDVELRGFPRAAHPENPAARESVELIVSRFTDELRSGKSPSISKFLARFPQHADELRELLLLVQNLEQWSIDKEVECVRSNLPDEFAFEQIGDYRIAREIGRGGMGVVFEATHQTSGRRVAIKLLPFRRVTDLARRQDQFRREATTLAGLRHRNIIPVFSFGQHQGYCYYVMQLIDGVSMDVVMKHIREGEVEVHLNQLLPVAATKADGTSANSDSAGGWSIGRHSWKTFARIGVQVLEALGHAHRNGVLHNDIKPANLLLDRSGCVFVSDFGVATRNPDEVAGEAQQAIGTLRYMAPERFGGESDARSDVYSFGATLYELLTRKPVLAADQQQQLIERLLKEDPIPPCDLEPEIPEPLARIVMKCLRRNPVERYRSADELRAELLRFINDRPLRTRGPSLLSRLKRWWRR